MRRMGEPKRPQIVFVGFEEDDPSYQAMAAMAAGSASVAADEEGAWLKTVRPAEWDVMVSRNSDSASLMPTHMFLAVFGGRSTGPLMKSSPNGAHTGGPLRSYVSSGRQPSRQLAVSTDLDPPALQRLVDQDLVPWLHQQDRVPYLLSRGRENLPLMAEQVVGPHFVLDADRHVVAGHFRRANQHHTAADSWCLALPHVPDEPALWLRVMLDIWREKVPARFAHLPTWWDGEAFRTPTEKKAMAALEEAERAHAATLKALEQDRLRLQNALLEAQTAASIGLRRLLTEQGELLVDAVRAALESLGFEVVDADAERGERTAKMEDLRVSDPAHKEWSNLTEVKGYKGGARTSDLLTLSRYASAFQLANGVPPSSRWYVVNLFMSDPPDGRPVIMQGADEDVAVFAADGGLVVDTRDLFALARDVEAGALLASAARDALRTATGRFAYSSPTP